MGYGLHRNNCCARDAYEAFWQFKFFFFLNRREKFRQRPNITKNGLTRRLFNHNFDIKKGNKQCDFFAKKGPSHSQQESFQNFYALLPKALMMSYFQLFQTTKQRHLQLLHSIVHSPMMFTAPSHQSSRAGD